MPRRPKMELVRWIDSMETTGWRPVTDALADLARPGFLECETLGFVVGESAERLMLSLNFQALDGQDQMVGETITIPIASVLERREVRVR